MGEVIEITSLESCIVLGSIGRIGALLLQDHPQLIYRIYVTLLQFPRHH